MFDTSEAVDSRQAAGLVASSYRAMVDHETRLLLLAAHWADLHAHIVPSGLPGCERLRGYGGVGTPEVAEFAAAELGVLQDTTTTTAAAAQMADALDLRHRLPRLWQLVQTGGVRVWKARAVAKATRHLTEAAARTVDEAVVGPIATLPWNRFDTVLQARIWQADPAQAARRQELYDAERFVRAGRTSEHGLTLLIARANAGDVIWFMAMVNRIADLLATDGDLDAVDVRRSKAIGILAQPAIALALLQRHHQPEEDEGDTTTSDDEPVERHDSVILDGPILATAAAARAARPPVTLYLHLSEEAVRAGDGVARMETVGPVLLHQLQELLAGTHITIRPVIDPAVTPVDGYEIPDRTREQVILTHPYDIFPFGTTASRHLDLDHTQPYRSIQTGGPPGQTAPGTLGPLTRNHHRAKTHAHWQLRQPSPGVFLWRSPHGYYSLVTNHGTLTLGNGTTQTPSGVQPRPHEG